MPPAGAASHPVGRAATPAPRRRMRPRHVPTSGHDRGRPRRRSGWCARTSRPPPLIRSYALERELGLPPGRRVWLKDYGWTPSGSFKLLGGLNWMANNLERIGDAAGRGPLVGQLRLRDRLRRDAVRPPRHRRHAGDRAAGEVRADAVVRRRGPHLRHHPRPRDRRARPADARDRRGGGGRPGVAVRRPARDRRQRRRRPGGRPRPAARGARRLALLLPGQRRRADGRPGAGDRRRLPGGPDHRRRAGRGGRLPPVARRRAARPPRPARAASATACCRTTWANTTGRSCSGWSARRWPCRTRPRGRRCGGCTTSTACAPSRPARSASRPCSAARWT